MPLVKYYLRLNDVKAIFDLMHAHGFDMTEAPDDLVALDTFLYDALYEKHSKYFNF
jgi:hypothetical protein